MQINGIVAALAALVITTTATDAAPIRFEYDTAASLSGTWSSNSWSQNSAGYYAGVSTTAKGLDAAIKGYVDIDSSGSAPVVTDFALNLIVPHGVPAQFLTGTPSHPTNLFSSTFLTPTNGGVGVVYGNGYVSIKQDFTFMSNDGPLGHLGIRNPYYDPTDFSSFIFQAEMQFRPVAGAGPNGTTAYSAYRASVTCNEPNKNIGSCNGFYASNYGGWYGSDGAAFAAGPVPTNPMTPVPLPAGLPLMLAGLASLGFLRSKAKA